MAKEYKKIIGREALKQVFESLIKDLETASNVKSSGLFSASAKQTLTRQEPKLIDFEDNKLHALISVLADRRNPSILWYDIGENPKISPEYFQDLARRLIEVCRIHDDWHNHYSDFRADVLKAVAEWTAASVTERPENPPIIKPKATLEDRMADGKKFIEKDTMTTLTHTPSSHGG